jgi:hypothetical protein
MRKVVDSNFLRTKELRDYLCASRDNVAVVTDYAELEMVSAETLEGVLKSTEILAEFPRQVILSKPTGVVSSLRGKKKGLKKRFTDGRRTRAFRKWCRIREQIRRGEKPFNHERTRDEARAHLSELLDNIATLKDDLEAHASGHYTADELRIIRTRKPFTPELTGKLIDGIMHFTLKFFEAGQRELPPSEEVPHTFIFRFALCAYLHALHWIAAGGAKDRGIEKFRNDLVDVALVAYGTCFDRLLSSDQLANDIHDNATFLLKNGFLAEKKKAKLKGAASNISKR